MDLPRVYPKVVPNFDTVATFLGFILYKKSGIWARFSSKNSYQGVVFILLFSLCSSLFSIARN